METVNIEKWIKENTFQCPMGRVSLQQCEALRKRRKFGEGGFTSSAEKVKDIYMPKVCENCTLWETLSKNKNIKEVVKVTDKKELVTCQDCGKEFEPYKNGNGTVRRFCPDCLSLHRKKGALKNKIKKAEDDGFLFSISFKYYPRLPEQLKKAANKNIRSVDHQALAYIIKGLEADGFDVERGEK